MRASSDRNPRRPLVMEEDQGRTLCVTDFDEKRHTRDV